jgi:hypothetical protein
MGKKGKTKRYQQRATNRKVDESTLPAPPPPISEEVRFRCVEKAFIVAGYGGSDRSHTRLNLSSF